MPTMTHNAQTTITNNAEKNRYEAHIDGELAGFADYMLGDGVIFFTHTEVERKFEGRGVGGAIVRHSLDEIREQGELKVKPLCGFYISWIARHPDYADLLDGR